MRRFLRAPLLVSVLAASSFAQNPGRFPPDIVPPSVLNDRDPLITDPGHFKLAFQNPMARALRLTLKGGEAVPMHEESEALAVCLKECHLRLSRPDGKIQDLHMEAGDVRWVWEDTRAEKNLSSEPLEMLLIEMKNRPRNQN